LSERISLSKPHRVTLEGQTILNTQSMDVFEDYCKSEQTKKLYRYWFSVFLQFYHIKDPDYFLQITTEENFDHIRNYVRNLKERASRREISPNSIKDRLTGIKHFFDYNDRVLNWKKLHKLLPQRIQRAGSRAWNVEMIQNMLSTTTKLRNRFVMVFLSCTGVRVGSIPDIKLKHIQKIEDCYSVLVYAGDEEEYTTFMTPECSRMYESYIEKRTLEKEVMTNESPLFRQDYSYEKKSFQALGVEGLKHLVHRAILKSGQRGTKSINRFDIQAVHSFRKFFATTLKNNPEISYSATERLLGHQAYLDGSYYRPTTEELFSAYKKATQQLTINKERIQEEEIKRLEEENSEYERLKNQKESLEDKVARMEQVNKTILEKLEKLEK